MSAHTSVDIPAALLADPRVSRRAIEVYARLAATPQAPPDPVDLAADSTDDTPGTIRAALAELEEAGWLADGRPVR